MRTPLTIRARRYRPPKNHYRLLKACAVLGAKAGSYFPYGDITPCYDVHRYGCPYRRSVITALCQIAGFCPQKPIAGKRLLSGERTPCGRLRARAGTLALFLRLPALAHKRPCVGSSEPAAVSHMLAHMVSRLGLNAATDTRRDWGSRRVRDFLQKSFCLVRGAVGCALCVSGNNFADVTALSGNILRIIVNVYAQAGVMT